MVASMRSLAVLAALLAAAAAFYLPGVAPRAYAKYDPLPLLVNRLDSTESIVPYDYYSFDFCEPGEDLTNSKSRHEGAKVSENLGQILLGERIRHSPYKLYMQEDTQGCSPLCKRTYELGKPKQEEKFRKILNAIKKDYMHHFLLDNLPAVECTRNCRGGPLPEDRPYFRLGFPVGCAIGPAEKSMTICTVNTINNLYAEETFVNNHIDMIVSYHTSPEFKGARVVGLEVRPRSIAHKDPDNLDCGRDVDPQPFRLDNKNPKLEVIYSYSVVYKYSELKWASRWDTYLQSAENTSIHWFSIVNSLIIVVFLSGMVALILMRTLNKDISKYNRADDDEAQEEQGWKLVHGDVFRAPANNMLLSVLIGTGCQLLVMAFVVLFFACLGFLSPATRGGLMTAMVLLFIFLGTPAGYISARLYRTWGGEAWKSNVISTAFFIPGIVFGVFFLLNLAMWGSGSSAAVPFGTMVAIILLWFFISVPLTFVGAYFGFKKSSIEHPVRTNQIPRQIPPQALYTKFWPGVLMGGILPFGCVFIQLFFILNSIWGHRLFYVFGFLFIVFIILLVTTVLSTILLCYFHLCAEDYRWWWRAFLTSGSSALYLFLYSIVFYFRRMEVDGALNALLYFGYTGIAVLLYFLIVATAGFFGCWIFVRMIYGAIKVD